MRGFLSKSGIDPDSIADVFGVVALFATLFAGLWIGQGAGVWGW